MSQEDVKKKARVRDPKKELRACPNGAGRKALQISAKKQCRIGPRAAQACNTCDGWPADAYDEPLMASQH